MWLQCILIITLRLSERLSILAYLETDYVQNNSLISPQPWSNGSRIKINMQTIIRLKKLLKKERVPARCKHQKKHLTIIR